MSVKVSSFTTSGTGNQSVTGIPFLPEEIEFWVGPQTGVLDTSKTSTSRGVATATNQHVDHFFRDSTGPEQGASISYCIRLRFRNGAVMDDRVLASFVSFNTITPGSNYGFTLNYTVNNAGYQIRYRARD